MNPDTERWLKQAKRDLESAEKNYQAEIWYVCAFLAQQAAEKALKALIVEQTGAQPPRTHSVQGLADITGVRQEVPKEIVALDDIYVSSRYPDAARPLLPHEVVDEPRAAAAMDTARRVLSVVQRKINDG